MLTSDGFAIHEVVPALAPETPVKDMTTPAASPPLLAIANVKARSISLQTGAFKADIQQGGAWISHRHRFLKVVSDVRWLFTDMSSDLPELFSSANTAMQRTKGKDNTPRRLSVIAIISAMTPL
jgi:hypothetical protein